MAFHDKPRRLLAGRLPEYFIKSLFQNRGSRRDAYTTRPVLGLTHGAQDKKAMMNSRNQHDRSSSV